MKRIITIATTQGDKSVPAIETVPGLAIHKTLYYDPEHFQHLHASRWEWTITHIPSGRLVGYAGTGIEALRAAKAAAPFADWSSDLKSGCPKGKQVRQAMDDALFACYKQRPPGR